MKPIDLATLEGQAILRSLLLIKEVYEHGLYHSQKNDQLNKHIALANFHNSAEMIARMILLHYSIRPEKQLNLEFEVLLNEIDRFEPFKNKNIVLPYRQQVRNLNQQRNLSLHHGSEPEKSVIEEYRVFTKSFLYEVYQRYFGISFESLSRIDQIESEQIRNLLYVAREMKQRKFFQEALICIKLAFTYSTFCITKNKLEEATSSESYINSELYRNYSPGREKETLKKILEYLIRRITNGEEKLVMLLSGMDLVDYQKFESITPSCTLSITGKPFFDLKGNEISDDDVSWSIAFIIDTIMNWQMQGFKIEVETDYRRRSLDSFIDEMRKKAG